MPEGGELVAALALLDEAGLLELLGQPGQAVEGAGPVLAQVLGHLVEVHLGQRPGRGGRAQELLELVHLAQPPGRGGRVGQAHGVGAAEAGSAVPTPPRARPGAGSRPGGPSASAGPCPRTATSASAWSWARCSGVMESSAAWTAAICAANCSSSSSRVWGLPGKKSPKRLHERLEGRVEVLARLALLDHPVEGVEHLPGPLELLGVGVGHGLGHLVEEALGDLLAQLLEQLLEVLAGLGGDEVVLLEAPHLAGQVGGQQVELDAAFGHDVVGDLLAALVAGLAGVLGQGLEPGALLGDDLARAPGRSPRRPRPGRRCRAPPGAAGAGAP